MINKVVTYLNLNKIGAFELFVALYPILAGYTWGLLKGNLIFIALLAIWALVLKPKAKFKMIWLEILIAFVTIHELVLMTIIPVQSYFINNTLSIIVISLSIIPIARAVDFYKLDSALNWVSIFSIIGIIYQFTMVMRGIPVSPLKLPFLPGMESTTRLYTESIRPSSFFWEPAAFVTFLMVPLFISLYQKKYVWTAIIILSMFLSTSSTGILMSMVMLAVYILTQKVKFWARVFVVVLGIGLLYGLTHSSYFSAGIEKIENTDPEKNARIMNGYFLFQAMSKEQVVLGVDAANIDEYYSKHSGYYFGEGSVFVPAFWLTLAKYGIFGLSCFFMVYISILKKDKATFPYIVVLFMSMLFQSMSIGSSGFAYQLVCLYAFVNRDYYKRIKQQLALTQ